MMSRIVIMFVPSRGSLCIVPWLYHWMPQRCGEDVQPLNYDAGIFARSRALRNTRSIIAAVSLPVLVFCSDG